MASSGGDAAQARPLQRSQPSAARLAYSVVSDASRAALLDSVP